MRAREKVWSTKLRTLGGGATLSLALLAFGCGGSTPVVTPPVELPPVARNLLNTDDLAPPTVREGGPLSPTRPVARTAMRRALTSAVFSIGQRGAFWREVTERMSRHLSAALAERFNDDDARRAAVTRLHEDFEIELTVKVICWRAVCGEAHGAPLLKPAEADEARQRLVEDPDGLREGI